MGTAVRRLAAAVADFVERNFEQVFSRPPEPPR